MTYFTFVGVTTTKSSIMRIFPLWMKELGKPEVQIVGVDHPMHDRPENYRHTVTQIRDDPQALGGLVTTHKVNLLEASRDLFDYLNPDARICGEISSISKKDGFLEGHAFDPITAGLSLSAITGPGYFGRTGGEVLCFGAGGSAAATALHLLRQPEAADRPRRFVVVNRSQPRLDALKGMVEGQGSDTRFEYVCSQDARANDALMAGMPEGSVVINATGMGKDSPGSPVTGQGLFPRNGIAWEFNYRGELDFLHQAEAQRQSRGLQVEDGWLYFLHGWTQVVAQVLHLRLTPEIFGRLAEVAVGAR